MAKLVYSAISSLDGFMADKTGNFDWAEPDEEVHTFINHLERQFGTYLYGRRMYEIMAVWENIQSHDQPPFITEFAEIWRAADKVVYSTTLESISTARTRLERDFDPEAVRLMMASAALDISVSGPNLAAHAFRAGLIDECLLFVVPIIVGDGLSAFPGDIRLEFLLQDERRFTNGMVYLCYRSVNSPAA
jgi:dihydrofolate reductase